MKIQINSAPVYIFLSLVLFMSSCKKEEGTSNPPSEPFTPRSTRASLPDNRPLPIATATISGLITTDTFLDNDHVWIIDGPTYVDSLVTLTIEAGTYLKALDKNNSRVKYPSFLVIRRGAKIMAEGTPNDPIVFTSQYTSGNRAEGDWGGIFLLGQAPVNVYDISIAGIHPWAVPPALAGRKALGFGGNIENDNSGILRHIRIEFAGDYASEEQLGGLALAGVGSATTVDHIQISYSGGDAFKFIGGSVNATHLISYLNNDDDFDFEMGYQGSIQFAVGQKDSRYSFPRSASPNGIESYNVRVPNMASGTYSRRITRPVLSNFSLLGDSLNATLASSSVGTAFRFGSGGVFKNSVVAGFYSGAPTNTASPSLIYTNNHLHYFHINNYPGTGNTIYWGVDSNGFLLTAPYNVHNPDWRYFTEAFNGLFSPLASGWNGSDLTVTHSGGALSSFTNTGFIGAFGENDNEIASPTANRWDATGWASYQPTTNTY